MDVSEILDARGVKMLKTTNGIVHKYKNMDIDVTLPYDLKVHEIYDFDPMDDVSDVSTERTTSDKFLALILNEDEKKFIRWLINEVCLFIYVSVI